MSDSQPRRRRGLKPRAGDPAGGSGGEAGFYEALGRAIKVERTRQDLERKDLAERSGISYPYLSEIENGSKRASSKAIVAIARALGLHPSDLLRAAETTPPSAGVDLLSSRPAPTGSAFHPAWLTEGSAQVETSDQGTRARIEAELAGLAARLPIEDLITLHGLARRLADRSR